MEVTIYIMILLKISFTNCEMEGFIVGGDFVRSIKEFPYVAALALQAPDGDYICGSSILNQVILITAAHCLQDVISGFATVGSVDRLKGNGYAIYSYKRHERYDEKKVRNDVSLCRLTRALTFGNTVQRVILTRRPPQSEKAEVAGWGAVEEVDYTGTDLLKHTVQRIWTHNRCNSVYASSLPVGTICGGERQSRTDMASKGDSGSGLVIRDNIIIGLVSFKNFQFSRSLVVYTDTVFFYDWITKNAQRLAERYVN